MNVTFNDILPLILENTHDLNHQFKRIFHGRGGLFKGFEYLTIDSIDKVLFVCLFKSIDDDAYNELIVLLETLYKKKYWQCVILQERFLLKAPSQILFGTMPKQTYAHEGKLKYHLNFMQNQNIGFFGDMIQGRQYVQNHSKNKNVLNLFSYTCAFSVCAQSGGAVKVVNVDMSKSALTTGRQNHHLNDQNTKNIHFLPYNILKSWSKIKKHAPYDLIIIDPPTFQKGSFAATKDYEKIIKRLGQLASKNCTVLSALNAPDLDVTFMKTLFALHADQFKFVEQLKNPSTYENIAAQKALKNLIFRYTST